MYEDPKHKYVAAKEAMNNTPGSGKFGGFIGYEPFSKTETCLDPEHNPPGMVVLPPGIHTYRCPSCGYLSTVRIAK